MEGEEQVMAPIIQVAIGYSITVILGCIIFNLDDSEINKYVGNIIFAAINAIFFIFFIIFVSTQKSGSVFSDSILNNISFCAIAEAGFMLVTLCLSSLIYGNNNSTHKFLALIMLVNTITMPIFSKAIENSNCVSSAEYVETDEITKEGFKLLGDENGKFIYYASKSASEEGYYIVYYMANGKYEPLKIEESKLCVLDSVEESKDIILYKISNIHKKECINEDTVEPEITEVITYEVYVPNGLSSIAIIPSN